MSFLPGDYVLTGGELPAMMMIDCISRLIPGVLNNQDSAEFESFMTIFWSIPNIPVRRYLWENGFRKSSFPAITPISKSGGGSSRS